LNTDASQIFLSYGRVSDSSSARAKEGRLIAARGGGLGRQVALIGAKTPAFRLNSPGWLAVAPELAAALDSRAMLRTLCRDRLMAATPAFAAYTRRVVEAYLERIGDLAGPPPEQVETVTDPSDRFFAALLPMPNAHIQPVTVEEGGLVPVAGHDPVRVDLAFWDGRTVTAINFGGAGSRLPRQARALTALEQALGGRISVHEISDMARLDLDTILPEAVFAEMKAMTGVVFGPFRAAEFQAALPDCD
jgi:hypothetical protein